MTKEESIAMWNIEKNSADSSTFTKKMKKLFSKVEELIMSGELMYDQFSGDMLDAVTDMIIDNTIIMLILFYLSGNYLSINITKCDRRTIDKHCHFEKVIKTRGRKIIRMQTQTKS